MRRCARCENARFGAMLQGMIADFNRDVARLKAEGAEHTCQIEPGFKEEPPAPEPEPEPPAPEPTTPDKGPVLVPVAKKPRHYDWMG